MCFQMCPGAGTDHSMSRGDVAIRSQSAFQVACKPCKVSMDHTAQVTHVALGTTGSQYALGFRGIPGGFVSPIVLQLSA